MGVYSVQYLLKNADHAASVTPSDSADLSNAAIKGLYVGGTGNIKVTTVRGDTVTFNSVPVGFFNVGVKRVFSTGTTATNIIALY